MDNSNLNLSRSEKIRIGQAAAKAKGVYGKKRPTSIEKERKILECVNDPEWNGTIMQIYDWTKISRVTISKVFRENGIV